MKKILALLLAGVLCLGIFAACGETPDNPSDTPTDSNASSGSTENGDGELPHGVFDPEVEHKIILGDVENLKMLVLDLNKTGTDWDDIPFEDPIWEWDPQKDPNSEIGKTSIRGFSDAKFRYSEHYGCDVVIACNSAGWFGVIDYENKTTLWESKVANGPHSIEMMPNGDLLMIGSGGSADGGVGSLYYYPLSVTESTDPSGILKMESGHGIQYDPDTKLLWAVYGPGVEAISISGYGTANAKPIILDGMGAKFENDNSGHDLAPVAGEPTKYWVTASNYVWQFDTEEGTLTRKYSNASQISEKSVKGIASFKDGTMVQAVAGKKGTRDEMTTYEYSTYCLRIIYGYMTTGKVSALKTDRVDITFDEREFYKVHAFDKSYK